MYMSFDNTFEFLLEFIKWKSNPSKFKTFSDWYVNKMHEDQRKSERKKQKDDFIRSSKKIGKILEKLK